jgi:hypothetical protein
MVVVFGVLASPSASCIAPAAFVSFALSFVVCVCTSDWGGSATPPESSFENYCNGGFGGVNRINDNKPTATLPYICEYDIPGAGYTMSTFASNELFLRGQYIELGFHARASIGTS